jgi:phosphoribosylformylglycinamidine cyclo-ligase
MESKNSYKNAGVDISAGEELISRIKSTAKKTFNQNVLTGLGHFGAFYKAEFSAYKEPVLVSSVDGVGTKLKVAIAANKHDTVGQDLVNHCVNDIAVGGAAPLFFMDYLAFGKLNVDKAEQIISGFSKACVENNLALIGGETAEMPGLYDENDYDISGTIVGVVDKAKILAADSVKQGDVLIGFESNGLHTNGYSLARKVLFPKYNLDYKSLDLELALAEELLRVHRSYLKIIRLLIGSNLVNVFSHITGGGIIGNTKRVVPEKYKISVNWNSWEIPPLFQFIQKSGNISDAEMRKVFNLGVGLVAIVSPENVDDVFAISKENFYNCFTIGEIV